MEFPSAFSIFVEIIIMSQLQTYQLSDLMNDLQLVIKSSFDHSYWVVAEIANVSGSNRGHLYLELVEKEEQQIIAKARANLWSYRSQQIIAAFEDVTKESLKIGMKVLLQLQVEFHPVYGLSFQILDIDPSYSLGELERQKQECINRLKEEGLLDFNKQYVLPSVIQNLAIISSETAAGYQDFMNQLESNAYQYTFQSQLFPAIMQGEKAPHSIIAAANAIEDSKLVFDAIVIIRGGGSNLDLACFDDYTLNARLAQSYFPIFSGIGHERDQSVTDMIAHTRLKTPTAVAEFIIQHNFSFENQVSLLFNSILESSKYMIDEQLYLLEKAGNKIMNSAEDLIENGEQILKDYSFHINRFSQSLLHYNSQKLNQKYQSINYNLKALFLKNTQHLNDLNKELKSGSSLKIQAQDKELDITSYIKQRLLLTSDKQNNKLDYIKHLINISDPENILKKGFSITRKNGVTIRNERELKDGEIIETILSQGKIMSKTIKKK